MQDFRLVLIIVGALAIAALLVHGLWSNHKNKPKSIKDKPVPKVDKTPSQPETDEQSGFDADGIGEVRVVSGSQAPHSAPTAFASDKQDNAFDDNTGQDIPSFSAVDKAETPAAQFSQQPYQPAPNQHAPASQQVMSGEVMHTPEPAAVVSDSPSQSVEPHGGQTQIADSDDEQYITRSPAFKEPYFDEYGRQHYREPQPIKVKVKPAANVQQPTPAETADPLREPAAEQGVQPASQIAQTPEQPEPVVDTHSVQAYGETKEQAPAEQEAVAPANTASAADVEQPQTTDQAQRNSHQQADNAQQQTSPAADPQEVFVLNVMSSEGQLFAGAELLPTLLNLGFKFGEMDIFHRHLSPTGNGPVLFSMANMVKPGTFDVDHMEQFETHGVSLFMALPCAGDPSNNFALMLHAAEMLASELNGAVFDATRQPLTRQKVNEYKQRINDFERKNALVH